MSEFFKFNQNTKCEYFPCHKGISKENFNCLFCYCPLYMLKDDCGGHFTYNHGIKDCSKCTLPHSEHSYQIIMEKMGLVIERTRQKSE